ALGPADSMAGLEHGQPLAQLLGRLGPRAPAPGAGPPGAGGGGGAFGRAAVPSYRSGAFGRAGAAAPLQPLTAVPSVRSAPPPATSSRKQAAAASQRTAWGSAAEVASLADAFDNPVVDPQTATRARLEEALDGFLADVPSWRGGQRDAGRSVL
ncbi:unnamed protein product, partial [Prorocentrum cordatum]